MGRVWETIARFQNSGSVVSKNLPSIRRPGFYPGTASPAATSIKKITSGRRWTAMEPAKRGGDMNQP